jgi:protein gp37
MKMAARLDRMGQPLYAGLTKQTKGGAVWTGVIRQASENVLLAPLRRKKPTTYFVNSMSDLFHEDVPDEWIDQVFAVMALSPQHTFQVLTKRASRLRAYMSDPLTRARIGASSERIAKENGQDGALGTLSYRDGVVTWVLDFPLSNVWLGTSTERQQEADERIPLLLQTPAAIRFISAEPLLGPIDLTRLEHNGALNHTFHGEMRPYLNALSGEMTDGKNLFENGPLLIGERQPTLSWVIVGGESGHGYRPMAAEWAYSLRDQCVAADVPIFIKQMAGRKPIPEDLLVRQFPV